MKSIRSHQKGHYTSSLALVLCLGMRYYWICIALLFLIMERDRINGLTTMPLGPSTCFLPYFVS